MCVETTTTTLCWMSALIFRLQYSENFWSLIPDDGGSTHLWNVGRQSFYTAVHLRRQSWWWWQYAPLKRRSTIILHGSKSQKTYLMMEAVRTSETSVDNHFTRQYISEGSPDDGGSMHLWNVGRQSFYTPVHLRRQSWWWRQYAPLKRRSTRICFLNTFSGIQFWW
jgi:hypothetical protein